MSDLISRSKYKSKLLKALDVLNKEYREAMLNEDNDLILAIQNQQSAYMIALRLLDNEPTAYDIDKVIEELERAKYEISLSGDDLEYYQSGLDEAIEIVKQGCVTDDCCEWEKQNDYPEVYSTKCGIVGAFRKNSFSCPYCRRKIKVVE